MPFETVNSLLSSHEVLEDDYSACLNPECEVIYFGENFTIKKSQLNVKVWFKEKTTQVPVCYCNNVTEQDIIDHILIEQCCTTLKDIQNHTGANTGKECLTKNPIGK